MIKSIPNSPPNRARLSPQTSRLLNATRVVAALTVVLQHARLALLVDLASVPNPSLGVKALYWASSFGHQAVVVFFVLSGALVGNSVLDSIQSDSWSWTDYLIRRLSRLYIVLVPALVLILAWDGVGAAVFRAPGLYGDFVSSLALGGHTWIVHNRSVAAVLGNLSFLMTIYVPVLGSGGALWSLSNEFWYYILFPFIALAVVRRKNSSQAIVYVTVIWVISFFVGRDIVEWMSVWLLGVAAARARRIEIRGVAPEAVLAIAFAVFVSLTLLERAMVNVISLPGDIAVGIGFALFLYAAFCRDAVIRFSAEALRLSQMWETLAGFSYTLYLFNQPPLAFAKAWLSFMRHSRWQPTFGHVSLMLALVGAIVIYSYGASRLTEARTDQLRRKIARHIRGRGHASQLVQLAA